MLACLGAYGRRVSPKRWSAADIPPLAGRTAVVTGANTGLGLETARALAAHGAAVVLAVRVVSKGEAAAADIRASAPGSDVTVQELDLASLASIRDAAATLHDRHDRIDLLVNNAGVMSTPHSTTEDGFELQFGVNHLGHFAFTGLLLDRLLPVHGSRIVTVSSVSHRFRSRIDLEDLNCTRALRPGLGLHTIEAGQPLVHLRASTSLGRGRRGHRGPRRAPRLVRHPARP